MSYQTFNQGAAPATPAASKATVYVDSADRKIKVIDDLGVIGTLNDDGLRGWNAIINGEFDYAQRQPPATTTTYSSTAGRALSADRFGITNENASVTYTRADTNTAPETGLQSRYYGKFAKLTSGGKMEISQVIEAGNCLHLRGRRVRFQAKMKFSVAASMTVRLGMLYLTSAGTVDTIPATFISAHGAVGTDPTWGANLTALAPALVDGGTLSGLGMTCVLTSAWVRYSAAFDIPSTIKNLIPVIWTNGQPAVGDVLNVAEMGLYDGPEIRDWVPRQQAQQLANCQRYYCKSFDPDTGPVQNAGLIGSIVGYVSVAGAVAAQPIPVRYPMTMRAIPGTLVFYNPLVANAFARNISIAADSTATASANVGVGGMMITFTGVAGWLAGAAMAVHYTADAEL